MRVNQDTRTIRKGEWFVPVKGERYDGRLFVEEALRKGAAGILEVEELYKLARKRIEELEPRVVAITGSYGKTTTKEAVYKVLNSKFEVLRTRGNLNTPLGIAMEVVNELKPKHKIFVAEVGMDHLGEIRQGCAIIKPQIGVVTSVGEMHLEKLGTLKNIRKAKSELLESLPTCGVAVLNYDDANVRGIAKIFGGRKIWYGFSREAGVNLTDIKSLKLLGEGSKHAALAACAVGQVLGVPKGKISKALRSLKPQKGRLNLLPGKSGTKVIDDTYNAGPRSLEAALAVLGDLPARRRIAILGDMLELGRLEEKAHREAIKAALAVADYCILVGPRYAKAYAALGPTKIAEAVKDVQEATKAVGKLDLRSRDIALVKGSQGMRMEKIVKILLEDETKASKLLVRQDRQWIC